MGRKAVKKRETREERGREQKNDRVEASRKMSTCNYGKWMMSITRDNAL